MRLHFFNSAAIANSKMDYCKEIGAGSSLVRARFCGFALSSVPDKTAMLPRLRIGLSYLHGLVLL